MRKEPQPQMGSNRQTPGAEHGLAVAGSAPATAETGYEKSRINTGRATGSIVEEYGIMIGVAKTGVVEACHP